MNLVSLIGRLTNDLHVYSCRRPAEEKRGITGS